MTREQDTEDFVSECIGPRQVNTVWRSDRDRVDVKVLAVDRDPDGWELWTITEVDLDGSQQGWERTHCTPWDPDRDRVISQPAGVL
jgi:hypothetical protein